MAIDEEAVLMRAGVQGHGGFPGTVLLAFERDGALLPVREVADQQHGGRVGFDDFKGFSRCPIYEQQRYNDFESDQFEFQRYAHIAR